MSTVSSEKPERGGCLTAWLIVVLTLPVALVFWFGATVIVLPLFVPTNYAASGSAVLGASGGAASATSGTVSLSFTDLLILGGAVGTVVGTFGLWKWKRWGFYVTCLVAFIPLVINLGTGGPLTMLGLSGFIGLAILGWLVKGKWMAFA